MRPLLIGTFGTSLTAGTGTGDGQWQEALRRAMLPGRTRDVQILNYGLPGKTSGDGLLAVDTVARLRLDAVLIEFCMNDAAVTKSVSLAASLANHQAIIAALRAASADVKVFLLTTNPVVTSIFGGNDRAAVGTYYAQYRQMVVDDPDLGLIDTEAAWGGPSLVNTPDGIHPTGAAWRSVAVPIIAQGLAAL